MSEQAIRVVLADDHTVVRAGLTAVLGAENDIDIVGEATNGRDAVTLVQRERPDVVIMDLSMPVLDGISATRAIRAEGLPTRVLMLTMHGEEDFLVPAMEAGAAGFLVKADAHRDLATAIRIVAQGDCFVRPSAAQILAKRLTTVDPLEHERRLYASLSQRERDVLRYVALGFTSAEVGQKVYVSAKMVEAHKHRIRTLLNLTHRSHYVQFALKLGLLGDGSATCTTS